MGLGPPVCDNCVVIMEYNQYDSPLLPSGYFCPICGESNTNSFAGIGPIESYAKYEDNLKFAKFMRGDSDVNE